MSKRRDETPHDEDTNEEQARHDGTSNFAHYNLLKLLRSADDSAVLYNRADRKHRRWTMFDGRS
jgi:hypothetical protein